MYFDQQMHGCAWKRRPDITVETTNHLLIIRFSSRASSTHDVKGTFFIIFECFSSFSTMQTHAQAYFAGRNTQEILYLWHNDKIQSRLSGFGA